MKRYSKQRTVIIDYLCSVTSHPTATEIYENARKIISNISLGTVYRNLSALTLNGEILCFKAKDGSEHYDGNPLSHPHFVCVRCNSIIDLELPGVESFISTCQMNTENIIQNHNIIFYGICSSCRDR